jgi:conjugative relaxase-like TrwC/TraI family protein
LLSIGLIKASGIGYYTKLTERENYWSEGGESPGRWFENEASRAFGLSGEVDNKQLETIAYGYDAKGLRGVQNAGHDLRRGAYDFTFSVPKSLSALWAIASDADRQRIEEAFQRAVDRALEYVNAQFGFIRLGQGGYELEKVDLLIAKFDHGTSRAQDPQLHCHALIMNVAEGSDGKLRTLAGGPLLAIKKSAGAYFRSALAEELGIPLERDPEQKFTYRVPGVSTSLTDLWSTRANEIEEEAKRLGEDGPKARALIAISTRQVKGHRAREEMQPEWLKTSEEHGLTQDDAREILARKAPEISREDTIRLVDEAIEKSVKKLTEHHAHFSKVELLEQVCNATATDVIKLDILNERIASAFESETFISVGRSRHRDQYTTHEIYNQVEGRALDDAMKLTNRTHTPIADKYVDRVIDEWPQLNDGRELNQGQRDVVRLVAQGPDLTLITGPPGSGKSTLFKAVREVIESRGGEIIGLCPTNRAARELERSSGIKSYTLDRFLYDQEKTLFEKISHSIEMTKRALQGRPTWEPFKVTDNVTIVVDECSMCENSKLASVLAIAEKHGARISLVGDKNQLQAINHGGLFAELTERGAEHQKGELTEIVRQREEWNRDAIKAIGEGKIAEGLGAFNERGFLHVAGTREETKDELIAKWKEVALQRPDQHLILAPTNKDVDALNLKAQEARLEAGELSIVTQLKIGGVSYREGDRIVWTGSQKRLGIIKNEFGTIDRIDQSTGLVTVDIDGAEEPVVFSPRRFDDFRLAYATTVHRAQGISLEGDAFVLMGGAMAATKEMTYVQVSRAKECTHLFVDGKTAGKELKGLIEQVTRSEAKQTAHTIARENNLDLSNTLHLSL